MKRLQLTMLVRDENEAEVRHWLEVAIEAACSVGGVRHRHITSEDWGEDEWKRFLP